MDPAANFPRHAADFDLNVVRVKCATKVAAVFLDRAGWFIALTEKSDGEPAH